MLSAAQDLPPTGNASTKISLVYAPTVQERVAPLGHKIGARILDEVRFDTAVREQMRLIPESAHDDNGMYQAQLPMHLLDSVVSSGLGLRVTDPDAYIIRVHEGVVRLFLKRSYALPVDSCEVRYMRRGAFTRLFGLQECERMDPDDQLGWTHVVTKVDITAGPGPIPAYAEDLVKNLAHRQLTGELALSALATGNNGLSKLMNDGWHIHNFWSSFCKVSD